MTLAPRQTQIISLIAHGYTYKEVADYFGLSPSTIKAVMSVILAKLEARNAPHAVYICMANGLILKEV